MNASGDISWMLISSALVMIMTPGLAFFYGGLVKRKNLINTMMPSISIMGIGMILWVLIGFSLCFSGGKGGFIGNLNWFGLDFGANNATAFAPTTLTFALFQMMFAVITPALITGAIVERIKFSTTLIFLTIWTIIVYYPMAHMVWGGGFLAAIGSIDFAGGNAIHITSGISALVLAHLLGKRKHSGKVSRPHNVPFVLLGAALLWFGWFGFNGGSAGAANDIAIHAIMTTNVSCAAAIVSWMLIEKLRTGKVTLVGISTAMVIGLVAITPGAGYVPIWASIIIGALVSPICYFFVDVVKPKFGYDDALDVFGCHGIGGIWGGIATGLFASQAVNPAIPGNGLIFGSSTLFLAQLEAIALTIVVAVVGTFIAIGIAKFATKGFRVSAKEEDAGLDITIHGESAYPSFDGID